MASAGKAGPKADHFTTPTSQKKTSRAMPALAKKTGEARVSLTPLDSLPAAEPSSGDQSFACEHCPMSFDSEKGRRIHFKWRHSKDPVQTSFECAECSLEFALKHEYHEHMGATHGRTRTHVCRLCQKSYSWAQGLYVHMKRKHRDAEFDCGEEGSEDDATPTTRIRKNSDSSTLNGEIGESKRLKTSDLSSTLTSNSISKQNGTSSSSKQGQSASSRRSSSTVSEANTPHSKSAEVEASSTSSNSTSSQAVFSFYGTSEQETKSNNGISVVRRGRGRPRKIHRGVTKRPAVEFNVARQGPSIRAAARSHSIVGAGRVKAGRTVQGSIKCYACDKAFADGKLRLHHLLTAHARINDPEVLTNCEGCKTLKNEDLRRHVSDEHQQQCLVCDKVFIYSKSLIRHMARDHQREQETVRSAAETPNVKDSTDLPKKGSVKCYACDKAFTNSKLKLHHLLTVHAKINEPEVLATCNLCKTLEHKALRRHVTAQHPQQCLVCDKVFIYSKSLIRHMSQEHQRVEANDDEEASNAMDTSMSSQNGSVGNVFPTQSNASAVKKKDSWCQTERIQSEEMLRKRNAFLESRVREVAEENGRLSEELDLLRGERVVTNGDAEMAHPEELVDLRRRVEALTADKTRLVSRVLALRREGTDLRRKDFEMRRAFDGLNAEVRELKAREAISTLRLENAELRMRMSQQQPMGVMTPGFEKAASTLILASATSLVKEEPVGVTDDDFDDLVYVDSDEDDDVQNVWQNDISMTIKDE